MKKMKMIDFQNLKAGDTIYQHTNGNFLKWVFVSYIPNNTNYQIFCRGENILTLFLSHSTIDTQSWFSGKYDSNFVKNLKLEYASFDISNIIKIYNKIDIKPETILAEINKIIENSGIPTNIQQVNTPVKEKIKKFKEYLNYFERHYDNVQLAWEEIKKKCDNSGFKFMTDPIILDIIEKDVLYHDESKLSSEEFTQYRQFFYPTSFEEKNKKLFLSAWENHKIFNKHHWQNWTVLEDTNPHAEAFLVTMIIDWVAMSYEFGDTALDYYNKNSQNIELPEWAIELMFKIFNKLYTNE